VHGGGQVGARHALAIGTRARRARNKGEQQERTGEKYRWSDQGRLSPATSSEKGLREPIVLYRERGRRLRLQAAGHSSLAVAPRLAAGFHDAAMFFSFCNESAGLAIPTTLRSRG